MNRLFGIFHATEEGQHCQDPNGVVGVVFASVAIEVGVDLQGVNIILHYGAPSSIEDYFQVRIIITNKNPVILKFQTWSIFVSYFLLRNSMS